MRRCLDLIQRLMIFPKVKLYGAAVKRRSRGGKAKSRLCDVRRAIVYEAEPPCARRGGGPMPRRRGPRGPMDTPETAPKPPAKAPARRGRPAKASRTGDTAETILDCAEDLFSKHGFHGVTIREVAR